MIPNVNLYLIGALVAAILVGATGWKAYRLGQDNVRAEYAARDLQQAAAAAAAYKATEEKYRAKEQAAAQALAQVSGDYERKLTDAQGKTRIAMDAIRSGSLRLRDPGAKPQACGSSAASPAASASERDGPTAGQLSGAAADFLLTIAAEADRNTLQLTACQAVVAADRK